MGGEAVRGAHPAAQAAAGGPTARRRWAIVGCLVLAAALRFVDLGRQSLWIDEVLSLESAARPLDALAFEPDGHPPLYHLFLKVGGLCSGSELRGRVLSAAFGTATVALLIVVGTRMFGANAGLLAGVLLALSPLHVWYSREGRMYALAALLAVASSACLVEAVERGRGRDWLAYGATVVLGIASHYFMAGVAVAQGLFVLLDGPARRRGFLPLLLVTLGVLAGGALALPVIGVDRTVDWTWRTFEPAAIFYTAFVFLAGFGIGPSTGELHEASRVAAVAAHGVEIGVVAALGLLLTAAAVRGVARAGRWRLYLLLWLFVPPLLVFAGAALTGVAYNVRLVLVSLPAFVLFVALGIVSLPGVAAMLALAAVVGVSALSIARDHVDARYAREDVRDAATYLVREAGAGQRIVVVADYAREAIDWYTHGAVPLGRVSELPVGSPDDAERLVGRLVADGPLWCVLVRSWDQDTTGLFAAALETVTGGPTATFPGVRIYKLG